MGPTGRPLIVYLDSSDYSLLSDVRRETPTLSETRAALYRLAADQRIAFAFSGAHIGEMAPVEPEYGAAALARVSLLVELCGSNALMSFDELVDAELQHLVLRCPEAVNVLRTDGTWFPDLGDIMPPKLNFDHMAVKDIDDLFKSSGQNREMRRAKRREFVRRDRLRSTAKRWIANQDSTAAVAEIVAKYPMRPEDAKILSRYVIGQGTRSEAEAAFRHSLRDPRWLFQWFATHDDMLLSIVEWIRAPSENMAARLRSFIAPIKELHEQREDLRRRFDELRQRGAQIPHHVQSQLRDAHRWRPDDETQLVSVVKRMMESKQLSLEKTLSAADIDHYCPGLAVAVRTMYASAADVMSANSRAPKDSDFVDAIHALYAPYVGVFRADRYMSGHVKKFVRPQTCVVPNLEEVPRAIEQAVTTPGSV